MLKLKRIKLKKVKEIFKRLPKTLGKNIFLTFLGLLLISLIFSGFIFYKYNILVEGEKPEITEQSLKFKENIYQTILNEWQKRNERFSGADLKEYSDPFKISTSTQELTK